MFSILRSWSNANLYIYNVRDVPHGLCTGFGTWVMVLGWSLRLVFVFFFLRTRLFTSDHFIYFKLRCQNQIMIHFSMTGKKKKKTRYDLIFFIIYVRASMARIWKFASRSLEVQYFECTNSFACHWICRSILEAVVLVYIGYMLA